MLISITPREALDKCIWGNLCDLKGINPWALKEGRMSDSDPITLTEDEARQLRLLPPRD